MQGDVEIRVSASVGAAILYYVKDLECATREEAESSRGLREAAGAQQNNKNTNQPREAIQRRRKRSSAEREEI